jgi:hypothetical protein
MRCPGIDNLSIREQFVDRSIRAHGTRAGVDQSAFSVFLSMPCLRRRT